MEKHHKDYRTSEYSTLMNNNTAKNKVSSLPKEDIFKRIRSSKCSQSLCQRIAYLAIYLLCLYILLFGFMTGLLIIILQLIISQDQPFLTGHQTPLDLRPGLSHRPNINFLTSLILYESSDSQTWMPYVQNIRTFIYLYEEVNLKPQDGFATCENGVKSPDNVELVCKFYPIVLESCVKENNYGYDRGEPCIILKINKVYGWLPDIENTTLSNSPLVRCFGKDTIDSESLGQLHYYPNISVDGVTYGIFNSLYFPYIIQYAYRSPLVALQVRNAYRHNMLFITCRLFNLRDQTEPLNFELLID